MLTDRFFAILTLSSALFIVGYAGHKIMNKPDLVADKSKVSRPVASAAKPAKANSGKSLAADLLKYVPQDTAYFFGSLEPVSYTQALQAGKHLFFLFDGMDKVVNKEYLDRQSNLDKAGLMLASAYALIQGKPENFAAQTGLSKRLSYAVYQADKSPLLRVRLGDKGAFSSYLDSLHKKFDMNLKPETIGDLTVYRYRESEGRKTPKEKPGDPLGVQLVIAFNNEFAVFAAVDPDKAALEQVVGSKPLQKHLAVTRMQHMIKRHGFLPGYVGFMDHRRLLASIEPETAMPDKDSSVIKNTALQDNEPQIKPPFSVPPLKTRECLDDFASLAAAWPQSVFGYRSIESGKDSVNLHGSIVVESNDTELLEQLLKLRGFIPEHTTSLGSRPRLSMGLGIKVAELGKTVSFILKRFTASPYKCQSLEELRNGLLQSNPLLALNVVSGMANGVEGVSLSILDFEGDLNAKPQVMKSVDALMMLSAQDPQMVIAGIRQMNPNLTKLQLDPSGKPTVLPIPLTLDQKPLNLSLRGQHLLAFMGNKSQTLADNLAKDSLKANGLLVFNYDWGRLAKMSAENMKGFASKSLTKNPTWDVTVSNMESVDAQILHRIDVSKHGLLMDFEVSNFTSAP